MSPHTSSVLRPTPSRRRVQPHLAARVKAPGGSSADGSATSSLMRSVSWSWMISGCATTSAGRCSTADHLSRSIWLASTFEHTSRHRKKDPVADGFTKPFKILCQSEARNPLRNGAIRDFEQIDAFRGVSFPSASLPCEQDQLSVTWTQFTVPGGSIREKERFFRGQMYE